MIIWSGRGRLLGFNHSPRTYAICTDNGGWKVMEFRPWLNEEHADKFYTKSLSDAFRSLGYEVTTEKIK